ncbi:archease [Sulfodiicoccus acidiphilus]|uniref:Protein archease n=1 Tax=Sulfodiicoccus acidiphilus TaxID=1670455 RepID=A0A348B174_9CREN|nr:archease [Sulfodiicoccus acidiphilus]BBD71926.1 archease [Sulfodiicoccus acidiphilus]GGT91509.1 archease [Sulfodiicoccus acidiphilus]
MERFRFFDHTADVGVEAYGSTLPQAFENAGAALFELITDTSKVRPALNREIEVEGEDLANLLYRWIESLVVIHDSERLVLSEFHVDLDEANLRLKALVAGEKFNPSVHEPRMVVKAMTYHLLNIEKEGQLYKLTFVVDI